VGQSLIQQAMDGNTSASIFYMKTQAGWRETDQDVSRQEPITINLIKPDG